MEYGQKQRWQVMCYNCGCESPDNPHGKSEAITNASIQKAADAFDESFDETIDHMIVLLQRTKRERK